MIYYILLSNYQFIILYFILYYKISINYKKEYKKKNHVPTTRGVEKKIVTLTKLEERDRVAEEEYTYTTGLGDSRSALQFFKTILITGVRAFKI